MSPFDDALGRGPEGPSYRPPVIKPRGPVARVRGWLWYRFGVGHRPLPVFEDPEPTARG